METVVQLSAPLPSVWRTWPLVPSAMLVRSPSVSVMTTRLPVMAVPSAISAMVRSPVMRAEPATSNLAVGEDVPMPTLSPELTKDTVVPERSQASRDVEEAVMVTDLVEVLVSRLIPVPATNVRESVLESALISESPETLMVLKMFWAEPRSVLVMARPSMERPSLAVKVMSPVSPWTEVIPAAALMVRSCSPVIVMPVPAVSE